MEDYLQLAAGTWVACINKHFSYPTLTLPEETGQRLCDGFRCEGRSRLVEEYGDCTQGTGGLCSTKLPDAERPS